MRFDHDEIRKTMDRDVAESLFAALVDPETSNDQLSEIERSLAIVDDPRLSDRLRAVVFDEKMPDQVRLAAYDVVDSGSDYFSDDDERAIWVSGNETLQHRILGSLRDPQIVLPIARDPDHRLHARAIDALAFGFEQHQALAIAALAHDDAVVRRAAASTLLWEEPIDAVVGLLLCLDDIDAGVREEAENALQYFPDRRVLRRLHALGGDVYEGMRCEFVEALQANPDLAGWMHDVAELVVPQPESTDEPPTDEPPTVTRPPRSPATVDVAVLIASLADLGGCWSDRHDRFRSKLDWGSVPASQRAGLAELLRAHLDPSVRVLAPYALVAWGMTDSLLEMIDDANDGVSKSAIYNLVMVEPESRVAARLLELLEADRRFGRWGELLGSYARHADPADVQRFALERIRSSPYEFEQLACVNELVNCDAEDPLSSLADLLRRPTRVTWALDIALLEYYANRSISVHGLPLLEEVDDRHMADALVRYHAAIGDRSARVAG